jgi:Zn-dependent protease with chaperone function
MTRWNADYFDGKSARKQSVLVIVTERGLRLQRSDGSSTLWPYEEITQTQGKLVGEHVRFERGTPWPEAVVIADAGILAVIDELAPQQNHQARTPMGGGGMLRAALGATVGLVVGGWGMYMYGLPAIADLTARVVPVKWEVELGRRTRDEIVPASERCADAPRTAAVQRIVDRLVAAGGATPYHYEVVISSSNDFNAFAAPGGFIVVNQGLLGKTRSPEQLAGVLAHEIQHVERRHATKAICEELSGRALIAVMLGNGDGFGSALNAMHALGSLGHSRAQESEADREGMKRVIAAGIDPKGMVEVFEIMKGESPEGPPALLSDHPDTVDRLKKLKAIAATSHAAPRPLDVGMAWSEVTSGCGAKPTSKHPPAHAKPVDG